MTCYAGSTTVSATQVSTLPLDQVIRLHNQLDKSIVVYESRQRWSNGDQGVIWTVGVDCPRSCHLRVRGNSYSGILIR